MESEEMIGEWLRNTFTWGRASMLALAVAAALIGLPKVFPSLHGMQQDPTVLALILAGIIIGIMAGFQVVDDELVRDGYIEPIRPQPGIASY